MLLSRPLMVDGQTWGTIYTLENIGDVFPTHVHGDADNHITALLFGAVRVCGHPDHDGVELHARAGGTVVNWTAGKPHGFVALTDGATLMNLRKVRP
jgi:hypothetical protein